MQRLKSFFISGFCTYLLAITGFGLFKYFSGDSTVSLLLAIQHAIGLSFFIGLFVRKPVRTSALLPKWTISQLVLVLAVSYQGYVEQVPGLIVLSSFGWLGWCLYLFWYSSFGGRKSEALVVGKPLPEFSLFTPQGDTVTRIQLANKPTLLIFYRGNWCPLCVAQVKEISALYSQLDAMGVDVCLVSPQPEQNTQQLADRFKVPFKFLVDRQLHAAEALGIKAENGTPTGMEALGYDSDTVRPTVLITDEKGVLVYSDLTDNYRVRPEPEDFIKVFQAMGLNAA